MASKKAGHPWAFRARFHANAFGWKSQPAIARVREAVAEIKKVAKSDPLVAAEGAVLFLERVSPALAHVDGSSGAIGSAVNRAIEDLVPLIAGASADAKTRDAWLELGSMKLHAADEVPYIETLANHWGELCVTREVASRAADRLVGLTKNALSPDPKMRGHYHGTTMCLTALFRAERYGEILELLEHERFWPYKRWSVKALAATGKKAEAIRLAESSRGPVDKRRRRRAALRRNSAVVGVRGRGVRALLRRCEPCGDVPRDVSRRREEVPDEVAGGAARAARRVDTRR